ncbi:MAG: plastocyanin/azurin family copper-binding protein [Thermodesulfobacteriota bacterium]|nr:plastocyanin/azurin family copper-binding protein [Thermodesulfobacteriota bacterium]
MRNVGSFLKVIGVALILVMPVFMLGLNSSDANEVRVIRIYGGGGYGEGGHFTGLRLEPQTVTVSTKTTVVWLNIGRQPDVDVIFKEGKACKDGTDAAVRFNLAQDNCYVTSFVAQGETSSLKFTQKGTYKYKVKAGTFESDGKIIVVE